MKETLQRIVVAGTVALLVAISATLGATTSSGSAGEIRICRVDYNPPGRERPHDESITICNDGNREVNLRGWTISDNHAEFTLGRAILVEPGEHKVISGRVFNPTNNTNRVALANGGDYVKLTDPSGRLVDAVCWREGCSICKECRLLDETP